MKKPRISGDLAEDQKTKRNKLRHFDVGESLDKWPIQRLREKVDKKNAV